MDIEYFVKYVIVRLLQSAVILVILQMALKMHLLSFMKGMALSKPKCKTLITAIFVFSGILNLIGSNTVLVLIKHFVLLIMHS